MGWQYAIMTRFIDQGELGALNRMGAEGWELISVNYMDGERKYTFKRPIDSALNREDVENIVNDALYSAFSTFIQARTDK